ncbi:GTP diphosphokinase, partial [Colwellia sp. BRX8-2]|nr:GTP diphosphokinase [Colwellia sp. BRX8-2]
MVSVRKSHQISEINFEQWLSSLELSEQKNQALEKLWQQVSDFYVDQQECQTKSLEMVEILASLNLDRDSLCAAFLLPLYEYQ